MCRLFALHAGERDVAAEFWLLDAPTSIARQSERNADGYGMAALTARRGMVLIRNPVQASEDPAYRHVARRLEASEMLVQLRYASTGKVSLVNTHPFSQDGRLFAHNGVVGDLDRIEARLGANRAMVMDDTSDQMILPTDIPTRAEIDRLLDYRAPASVSIYLPTDPASSGEPERIELKTLAGQAASQLRHSGAGARVVRKFEEEIAYLQDDEGFWRCQARSLAAFATPQWMYPTRSPGGPG